VPQAAAELARQVTALVQQLRTVDMYKVPGVSETLDWVAALAALDRTRVEMAAIEETIGVVLKSREDQDALRGEPLAALLARALSR
jgi:MoxR-like ATPase